MAISTLGLRIKEYLAKNKTKTSQTDLYWQVGERALLRAIIGGTDNGEELKLAARYHLELILQCGVGLRELDSLLPAIPCTQSNLEKLCDKLRVTAWELADSLGLSPVVAGNWRGGTTWSCSVGRLLALAVKAGSVEGALRVIDQGGAVALIAATTPSEEYDDSDDDIEGYASPSSNIYTEAVTMGTARGEIGDLPFEAPPDGDLPPDVYSALAVEYGARQITRAVRLAFWDAYITAG